MVRPTAPFGPERRHLLPHSRPRLARPPVSPPRRARGFAPRAASAVPVGTEALLVLCRHRCALVGALNYSPTWTARRHDQRSGPPLGCALLRRPDRRDWRRVAHLAVGARGAGRSPCSTALRSFFTGLSPLCRRIPTSAHPRRLRWCLVAGSLAWSVALDGFRPDRYDILGALVCLLGVDVIAYSLDESRESKALVRRLVEIPRSRHFRSAGDAAALALRFRRVPRRGRRAVTLVGFVFDRPASGGRGARARAKVPARTRRGRRGGLRRGNGWREP